MLTRTVAVEQAAIENGVRIISVSPGVVNTDMQATIRGTAKEAFRDIDRFIELKNKGALSEPLTAARRIFAIDQDDRVESGSLLDVRTYTP